MSRRVWKLAFERALTKLGVLGMCSSCNIALDRPGCGAVMVYEDRMPVTCPSCGRFEDADGNVYGRIDKNGKARLKLIVIGRSDQQPARSYC